MTPSARIQAAIEILALLESEKRPADALISAYFRARRYIGSKDRGAISEYAYSMMRFHARIGWWIERLKSTDTPRVRAAHYLRLVEGKGAKEIENIFDGKKFSPAPLEDAERKALKKLEGHTLFHPEMPEDVVGECPAWAYSGLKERFGECLKKELEALLSPAPLDLRVNSIKATREAALEALVKGGMEASPCRYSPWGIRVRQRPDLNRVSMLRDGALEIQDEGSQLVAMLVDAKPSHRVVDFCAGAGGKTLAMAAQMENKGKIIACDVLEKRLKRGTERFRRAGFHNIETRAISGERDPWVKKHQSSCDRVLVDAPCSGAGTWRRNPDQRWRSLGPGLDSLVALQAEILDSAARLAKQGGRVVYATCSLLAEENERQIEKFLAEHKDFRLIPANEILSGVIDTGEYLSLSPARHGTDGFFAAVMERGSKSEE